jgi:DNA-binding MarR family transcriptional regulator
MSIDGLDPVVHAPARLQIRATLSATDEAEFALVREKTGVSESVLSKQVKQLEEAGYVKVRKAVLASRRRTWLSLTDVRQAIFTRHLQALTRLATGAEDGGGRRAMKARGDLTAGAFCSARRMEMERKDGASGSSDEAALEHREEMLDEALEETFPASDPPSLTWPPARPC